MSNTAQSLASKRIASLLDENSFVEIGAAVPVVKKSAALQNFFYKAVEKFTIS